MPRWKLGLMAVPFVISALLLTFGIVTQPPDRGEFLFVTGVPTHGDVSQLRRRRGHVIEYLKYSLGDYTLEHSSEWSGYRDVVAAIDKSEITVGVTPRSNLFGNDPSPYVWEVSVGKTEVLSFASRLSEEKKGKNAIFIIAGAFSFVGVMGIVGLFKELNRDRTKP